MPRNSSDVADEIVGLPAVRIALAAVDAVFAPALSAYRLRCSSEGVVSGKSIKDAVWGMIQLTRSELFVVDSPVFQRLRRIRQLGVTYLTFPTASYSRFDHSLGVLHQATRMIDAIATRHSQQNVLSNEKPTARLAALLHDIGHLPLSHVSERHFQEHPDAVFAPALQEINHKQKISANFSEVMSFCIAQSPSFRGLLIDAGYDKEQIDSATIAIIGCAPSGAEFLKQIISNVVDADKLDYMFRDSLFTSVPLPVDLDRLLYKLSCVQHNHPLGEGMQTTLAVDLGGKHLIDDLVLARRMLARQVYFHHKTLSAEQLVLEALRNLRPRVEEMLAADDAFFARSDFPMLVDASLRALAERRLPRRAFALSESLLQDGATITASWMAFRDELTKAEFRTNLGQSIVAKARELAAALERVQKKDPVVYVDRVRKAQSVNEDLLIALPDETHAPYSLLNAAATLAQDDMAYVYCSGSADDALIVHAATEEVLYRSHGLLFGRGTADYAKLRLDQIHRLKRRLEQADAEHYRGCRPLRASGGPLETDRWRRNVDKVRQRLASFHKAPDAQAVERYVNQFPAGLQETLFEVLATIDVISPQQVADGIDDYLRRHHLDADRIGLVALSRPGESGSLVSYWLKQKGYRPMTLEEAMGNNRSTLVFYEDSLFSGAQATTIVNSWFGLPGRSPSDRQDKLKPAVAAYVKRCDTHFVFHVGTDSGEKALRTCIRKTGGFKESKNGNVAAVGRPTSLADSAHAASTPEHAMLRNFFRDVGAELLRSTFLAQKKPKWNEKRCATSALGYGGFASLVAFEVNSPTATLTALWHEGGRYDGQAWVPLLPRLRKSAPETSETEKSRKAPQGAPPSVATGRKRQRRR